MTPLALYMHDCFTYDPEAGSFEWKARPACHFRDETRRKRFSTRWAGKPAFGAREVSNGRRSTGINGKTYRAHTMAFLLMEGRLPVAIDHINGDASDNRWENLREADHAENMKNLAMPRRNTSGVIGVTWSEERGKWAAQIGVGNKVVPLGRFEDKQDAIAARKAAEQTYGFHENHGRTTT